MKTHLILLILIHVLLCIPPGRLEALPTDVYWDNGGLNVVADWPTASNWTGLNVPDNSNERAHITDDSVALLGNLQVNFPASQTVAGLRVSVPLIPTTLKGSISQPTLSMTGNAAGIEPVFVHSDFTVVDVELEALSGDVIVYSGPTYPTQADFVVSYSSSLSIDDGDLIVGSARGVQTSSRYELEHGWMDVSGNFTIGDAGAAAEVWLHGTLDTASDAGTGVQIGSAAVSPAGTNGNATVRAFADSVLVTTWNNHGWLKIGGDGGSGSLEMNGTLNQYGEAIIGAGVEGGEFQSIGQGSKVFHGPVRIGYEGPGTFTGYASFEDDLHVGGSGMPYYASYAGEFEGHLLVYGDTIVSSPQGVSSLTVDPGTYNNFYGDLKLGVNSGETGNLNIQSGATVRCLGEVQASYKTAPGPAPGDADITVGPGATLKAGALRVIGSDWGDRGKLITDPLSTVIVNELTYDPGDPKVFNGGLGIGYAEAANTALVQIGYEGFGDEELTVGQSLAVGFEKAATLEVWRSQLAVGQNVLVGTTDGSPPRQDYSTLRISESSMDVAGDVTVGADGELVMNDLAGANVDGTLTIRPGGILRLYDYGNVINADAVVLDGGFSYTDGSTRQSKLYTNSLTGVDISDLSFPGSIYLGIDRYGESILPYAIVNSDLHIGYLHSTSAKVKAGESGYISGNFNLAGGDGVSASLTVEADATYSAGAGGTVIFGEADPATHNSQATLTLEQNSRFTSYSQLQLRSNSQIYANSGSTLAVDSINIDHAPSTTLSFAPDARLLVNTFLPTVVLPKVGRCNLGIGWLGGDVSYVVDQGGIAWDLNTLEIGAESGGIASLAIEQSTTVNVQNLYVGRDTADGSVILDSSGVLSVVAHIQLGDEQSNRGLLELVDNGAAEVTAYSLTSKANGQLKVGQGTLVSLTDSATFETGSKPFIIDGAIIATQVMLGTGTELSGKGQIQADVTADAALIRPGGDTIKTLTITGNLAGSNRSILEVGVDLVTDVRDQLNISGNAALDGFSLELQTLDRPDYRDPITILSAGELSGQFEEIIHNEIAANMRWATLYDEVQDIVTIQGALPGDVNLDGKITIGDLTIFAGHFGENNANWMLGDIDGNGMINIGDLSILAGHFGAVEANPTPIPEPATAALFVLVSVCSLWRSRRDT